MRVIIGKSVAIVIAIFPFLLSTGCPRTPPPLTTSTINVRASFPAGCPSQFDRGQCDGSVAIELIPGTTQNLNFNGLLAQPNDDGQGCSCVATGSFPNLPAPATYTAKTQWGQTTSAPVVAAGRVYLLDCRRGDFSCGFRQILP